MLSPLLTKSCRRAVLLVAAVALLAACARQRPGFSFPASRFIVGVSTPRDANRKEWVFKSVMHILLKAPKGSEIVVFDGATGETIISVSVQDRKSMDLDKVRLQTWQREILTLRERLAQEVHRGPTYLLNVPISLQFVATLPNSHLDTRVLLIGTPLYADLVRPESSMDEGLVPTIGHLCVEQQESPFSLASLGKRLAGYKFYILDSEQVQYKGREHRQAVRDFWKTMIEQAGGIWIAQTNDKDSFLKRIWDRQTAPPAKTKVDCGIEKAEWVLYPRPPKRLPWLDPFFPDVKPFVRAEPPIGYVKVGMVWQCRTCDFDLHGRPRSDTPFLYFGRARTPDGVFYKDYVTDPRIPYGLEYIEFANPVDLRQLEVLANFFGGTASVGDARFTFRLWFEPSSKTGKGEVIERTFEFEAQRGNRGEHPMEWDSLHWIRINTLDLIGR